MVYSWSILNPKTVLLNSYKPSASVINLKVWSNYPNAWLQNQQMRSMSCNLDTKCWQKRNRY
ncbi:hypothetical protein KAN5_11840 [Pseudoalteromonas sp. KAN5]|nr:hypothetical protein KAN5_11840 [Pseudoalteromonas sp. KAN5]